MAPNVSLSRRSNSPSPPFVLVGSVIGSALVLLLILILLAFIFYRWYKAAHEKRKRSQSKADARETFAMPCKLALPERLRRQRGKQSDAPPLEPLLSPFQLPDPYQSRPYVGAVRNQAVNHDLEFPGYDTVPVTASPSLGSRGGHRMYTAPPSLGSRGELHMHAGPTPFRDRTRSSTLPLTRDLLFIPPEPTNQLTTVTPPPLYALPSESTFTLDRYIPSLILPDSPHSSTQGTPNFPEQPAEASTRSFGRSSPESMYSQRSASTAAHHARPDPSTMPPVPPLPEGIAPYHGRNDAVHVRDVLGDHVGRIDHVDSISNLRLEGPSTRSTRKKSSESIHGLDKRNETAEPIRAPHTNGWRLHESSTVPPVRPPRSSARPVLSLPQASPPVLEPSLSRKSDSVDALLPEPHAPLGRKSAPPVLFTDEDKAPSVEAPNDTNDDVSGSYATAAPLNISSTARVSQPGMPPRALMAGPRPRPGKPSAMALRVGIRSHYGENGVLARTDLLID